eukprot:11054354-Lingulodinium_polyedra.AAC.1
MTCHDHEMVTQRPFNDSVVAISWPFITVDWPCVDHVMAIEGPVDGHSMVNAWPRVEPVGG